MNEFSKYHPVVNFIYFLAVICFSCVFMHPATLIISLVCGFSYSVMLNGKKSLKFNLIYMIPLILFTAIINPIFNHEGITIIFYLPDGNPITAEAVSYGIASAMMIWSVICHFSCFNRIMTSEKQLYLFGKLAPSLSLILSMVLRFVPKFKTQIHTISNGRAFIEKDMSHDGMLQKVKNGIRIISAMITWSFENAIDTADSMKSRGYGLPNRTAYTNYRLRKRDIKTIIYMLVLSIYIIAAGVMKQLYFEYFPNIEGAYSISAFIAYLLLFSCPIIIELQEELKWKKLKSKI